MSKNQEKYAYMLLSISIYNNYYNPMKLCWKLMTVMLIASYMLYSSMIKSFLAMIMMMLMIGGLLMMYVMMTSMMPNKKMKMWKISMFILMIMLLQWFYEDLFVMMELISTIKMMEMKVMAMNKEYFYMMMMMIITYFSLSVSAMNTESSSMRSYN